MVNLLSKLVGYCPPDPIGPLLVVVLVDFEKGGLAADCTVAVSVRLVSIAFPASSYQFSRVFPSASTVFHDVTEAVLERKTLSLLSFKESLMPFKSRIP